MAGQARVIEQSVDRGTSLAATRDALVLVLGQLAALVERLNAEQYTRQPVGVVRSSVGPHVRHALDHVGAWLAAVPEGVLDYDTRDRGTPVEQDPAAALEQLAALLESLRSLNAREARIAGATWTLRAQVTEGGPAISFGTTPERELAFVLSHTIHHHAVLGIMARELGVQAPERFGYAPATITHLAPAAQGGNDTGQGPVAG